jgi:recombination protein RecR
MAKLPSSIQKLINELSRLPGIGPKTAQRLAFYLLKKDNIDISSLSLAVGQVKNGIMYCSVCGLMSDSDPCNIDNDPKRDHSIICVVEETLDALAIDRTNEYNGVFHILGGALNPLEGIGPEKLNIEQLVSRIGNEAPKIHEVIIATNPSLEGETTAMHLVKAIKAANPDIKITRIARGLPMGGDLEYADDITLMRALEGRREY